MKRRNLCNTKKVVAVILAASMVMSSGVTALAEEGYHLDEGYVESEKSEIIAVEAHNETKTEDNAKAENDKGSATSVYAESHDEGSTKVTITNDVSANVTNSEPWEDTSTGVVAKASGNSKTEVNVKNDLSVSSDGESIGIDVKVGDYRNQTDNSSVNVKVGGDVSVNADTNTTDEGSGVYAAGVNINAYNSNTTKAEVNIDGDLNVSSEFNTTGIQTGSNGKVTVGGDLNVDVNIDKDNKIEYEKAEALGIHASGNSEVVIDGDINVEGTKENEYWYEEVTGINAYTQSNDSSVNITVGGDVNVSSPDDGYGIYGHGAGNINIDIGGSVNVTDNGEEGYAIGLSDDWEKTSSLTVKVAENVTASNTAVFISKMFDENSVDLVVGGTLSGGEHAIVLTETDSSSASYLGSTKSSTENLNITVWKIEPVKESGNIVETQKYNSKTEKTTYTENKEAEKNINYIIKVDPVKTSGGNLAVSGTTESHGYQTAHEGDKVYLEVTVPSGYTVDSFYNVAGAAECKFITDGDKHYLEVPRGGGVFVGVNLKKITSSDVDNSKKHESDGSSGTTGTQNQSATSNTYNSASGIFETTPAVMAMQIQAPTLAGTNAIVNVADILTPVDMLTAINNFSAAGLSNMDTDNIMGTGIVSFNNMFATAISDTIDVPVAAGVKANQSYTVYFSDNTSINVLCTADGILTIPFNKNAEGLTYIIYGTQLDPSMFIGTQLDQNMFSGMPIGGWTY
ncbi:hypothetical protein [Oribacterium sp. FC2011]|uniref:hypothetical protein n=1 Tax=Oribacterium sp. FC2011 TaxID=1408311 RepID=UPI0004E19C11|nr:hypothetical protein [Oribacterium sp. FC2011]